MKRKIINSNLPLPPNTIYDWHECFAKLILEKFFPKQFSKLEIKDRPDLQNKKLDVGIEVTTAIPESSRELEKLYVNLEYGLANNKENVRKKIELIGGKISSGILIHPTQSRTLKNIYNSFNIKINKLNEKNYTVFRNNILFIFDENHIMDHELNEIIKNLSDLQKEKDIKFNFVYFYIYGGNIYEFNLKLNKFKSIHVEKNGAYELGELARKIVEEKENEAK